MREINPGVYLDLLHNQRKQYEEGEVCLSVTPPHACRRRKCKHKENRRSIKRQTTSQQVRRERSYVAITVLRGELV